MFDWLKTTFLGALGPVLAFFTTIFNPAIAIVVGIWEVCQFCYNLIGKGNAAFNTAIGKYQEMLTLVGGSVFGNMPGQLGQALGFLNAFLPLTEALVLVAVAVVLYSLCVALRVLKSWIPTIG